jgi:uncharacterized membrane protein YGL010W
MHTQSSAKWYILFVMAASAMIVMSIYLHGEVVKARGATTVHLDITLGYAVCWLLLFYSFDRIKKIYYETNRPTESGDIKAQGRGQGK